MEMNGYAAPVRVSPGVRTTGARASWPKSVASLRTGKATAWTAVRGQSAALPLRGASTLGLNTGALPVREGSHSTSDAG